MKDSIVSSGTKLYTLATGRGFPLNTAFRYQTTPDLPLMEVPNNLFRTYSGAVVTVRSGGEPVQGTMAGVRVYVPKSVENSELVPEADRIINEYAMNATPMKYTIQFLDFASERSKSKTGSTEGESLKVGYTIDMSKLFAKESTGEISGEYQKSFETAFSYYVDQGKKYVIDLAYIKLNETYRDKLVNIDYIFKGSKYQTDVGDANDWMKFVNTDIDSVLQNHFDQLRQFLKK